jgi:hypothetical protein
MQSHAIVELEDGALTVTLGRAEGRGVRVTGCHRAPLPDLGREALTQVLRHVAGDHLRGVTGVHVVLGDRRMQHFVAELPRLAAPDVVAFAQREALRLTNMPNVGEVLANVRLLRRQPGRRQLVAGAALPRSVWEPLREAFHAAGIAVLGLQSTEACLAMGAPRDTEERCAVVECNAGRARFVLCDDRAPVQVRRFLVGSSDGNPDALAAQLAMELPRTVDWLRETGHKVPTVLVLGLRLGLGADAHDLIRGDFTRVVPSPRAPAVVDGPEGPGLASAALLHELCHGDALPSLLEPLHFRLPPSPLRRLWPAALLALGGLGTVSAVRDLQALLVLRDELADAALQREQLRHELVAADVPVPTVVASPADARQLQFALGTRRPASRLVAEISNLGTEDVLLDSLQFASAEHVVIAGIVRGPSRTAALARLADFAGRVRTLAYLDDAGQEDVGEVPGLPNHFRFRFGLAWRNS